MRNLKKVLALVLAVVMIFGVMSLTSATFTDDAKISNTEAVEVMAGLQILTGYTDGSYQPEGNVTREEMATIICKMLLGPEVAKTLTQGTSNFKDVAATRWSAGYIEYCANLGIIDGYGDGSRPGESGGGLRDAASLRAELDVPIPRGQAAGRWNFYEIFAARLGYLPAAAPVAENRCFRNSVFTMLANHLVLLQSLPPQACLYTL